MGSGSCGSISRIVGMTLVAGPGAGRDEGISTTGTARRVAWAASYLVLALSEGLRALLVFSASSYYLSICDCLLFR